MIDKISVTKMYSGQVARYKDSIYDYKIKSYLKPKEVEEYCLDNVGPFKPKHKLNNGVFNGSCFFPFGLQPYYRFIRRSEIEYQYTICSPYTG